MHLFVYELWIRLWRKACGKMDGFHRTVANITKRNPNQNKWNNRNQNGDPVGAFLFVCFLFVQHNKNATCVRLHTARHRTEKLTQALCVGVGDRCDLWPCSKSQSEQLFVLNAHFGTDWIAAEEHARETCGLVKLPSEPDTWVTQN